MSASFFIMSKEKRGFATLFVRLQNTKQKINHRFATRIQVDIQEKKKNRTLIRILGLMMLIFVSLGDAAVYAWQSIRKKWHKL